MSVASHPGYFSNFTTDALHVIDMYMNIRHPRVYLCSRCRRGVGDVEGRQQILKPSAATTAILTDDELATTAILTEVDRVAEVEGDLLGGRRRGWGRRVLGAGFARDSCGS